MTLVVDASVACKWFVAEVQSSDAETLLTAGDVLIAPDLIFPEVCNIAWRKLRQGDITPDQAAAMIDGLPALLDIPVPSAQLASRAFSIASATSHPAYDCFYIALAEQRGTKLVTADRRLLTRMAASPFAHLVVGLGDAA